MLLTIIIPVYNVEKYLEECLNSVVGIDSIEIIIVNDNSPDNSHIIIEKFKSHYSNIRVITHKTNLGLGAARNTGIKHATGKYVFFLDSDDYVDTKELKYLIKILQNISCDQILISFNRFDDIKTYPKPHKKFFLKNHGKILTKKNFKDLLEVVNLSQLRILRLDKIKSEDMYFPDGIYEDILWTYWFSYISDGILVLDNRMYKYRQRPGSILSSTSERHLELINQYSKTLDFFKKKNVDNSVLIALKVKFITHVLFLLFSTERLPQNKKKEFYERSKQIIGNIDFILLRKMSYSKKKIKKIKSFVRLNFENYVLSNDIKFLLTTKGIKKIRTYALFKLLKLIPSYKKIWVFGARFNKFTDNTKYFYLNNLEQSKIDNIKFIWISNNKNVVEHINRVGGTAFRKKTFRGRLYSLLAKYKFVNCWSNDIGFLQTANGELVNFWHGLPLKSIEYDIKGGPQSKAYVNLFSKMKYRITLLRQNDIVFNSSEQFSKKIESALRPKQMFNLGSPRLDILKWQQKEIIGFLEKYQFETTLDFISELQNYNKVFIYMPTFRDQGKNWIAKLRDFFEYANAYLKSTNSCMIVKLHQNDKGLTDIPFAYPNIKLYTEDDIYPILPFTDCLISDYSSIIFDYAILNKPILLFPFDKKEYISASRELYFDYDEIFSELLQAYNEIELINNMKMIDREIFNYDKLQKLLGETHIKTKVSSAIYNKIKRLNDD